jgi:hypothetical protein
MYFLRVIAVVQIELSLILFLRRSSVAKTLQVFTIVSVDETLSCLLISSLNSNEPLSF